MSSGPGPLPWQHPKPKGPRHSGGRVGAGLQSFGAPYLRSISAPVLVGMQSGRWRQFTNSQRLALHMVSFHPSLPEGGTQDVSRAT